MNPELFIPEEISQHFATVVLPIAVRKSYTYAIPSDLIHKVKFGIRVEVPFGKNKLYAGIVKDVSQEPPGYKTKPIISVIDEEPVITKKQMQLWQWMAGYYCCTLGEVMNASLPSGLKLASETRIVLGPFYNENLDAQNLTDNEFIIAEALTLQNELKIGDVKKILNKKTIYPIIKSMLDKKVIYLYEELKEKFKAKTISCVRFQEPYASDESLLKEAFEKTKRSNKQQEALLAYLQLSKKQEFVKRQEICTLAHLDTSVIKAIEKKGIFEIYKREVSRLGGYSEETTDVSPLSLQQENALEEIETKFNEKDVILLHGVTGSGKTRVYIELIKKAIEKGEQVLYLLPEIALTTQIVGRLQKVFGKQIMVYHSRMNNNERVELWRAAYAGKPILLGARSSLFLPFTNLKLIIVDEEHDPSFKQNDPAPRYNARDTAVFMSHLYNAKVILGTATPSLETYRNVLASKYELVEMPERFGGLKLPEVVLADMKEESKNRKMQSHFTTTLIDELKAALERGEQAILFQNRRGYSPTVLCTTCGWKSECVHCDVSLTYHKYSDHLRCHYCGYMSHVPETCAACGNVHLDLKGFGTEKIADELQIYMPTGTKIARMDWDTVRGKNSLEKLINDFEEKRIDILVGTQMVTKGLDFDNVGIVGILSADHLIHFPDFRASERAFQLMLQVSGRAGRKHKQGKVVIQTYKTDHPLVLDVLSNNFRAFLKREMTERKNFKYPPFHRLIKISLKHKKRGTVQQAAEYFGNELRIKFKDKVIGPAEPGIPRVRSFYLQDIILKLDKNARLLKEAKSQIHTIQTALHKTKGFSTVRIVVDVDPY